MQDGNVRLDTDIERMLDPVTRRQVAQESGESEAVLTEKALIVPG